MKTWAAEEGQDIEVGMIASIADWMRFKLIFWSIQDISDKLFQLLNKQMQIEQEFAGKTQTMMW